MAVVSRVLDRGLSLEEALAAIDDEGLKVGIINTLGERRDRQAVPQLAALIGDGESEPARAALASSRLPLPAT